MMQLNALVVDDSGIMRKLVMRSLTEANLAEFTFTEAKDGVDALNLYDKEKTDILFVDWNMPNMSGIDFAKKVREIQTRDIPIVMITTEGSDEVVTEARVSGANGYLKKPFTPEKIQAVLGPLLS